MSPELVWVIRIVIVIPIAALLWISGCSRSDILVIGNEYSEEICVSRVNVDTVASTEFSIAMLNGAVSPWRGGTLIIESQSITGNPTIEIEWMQKNTLHKSSCSYQKNRKRCEVEIAISEQGLVCSTCARPLGF